jgi:hypothetical protein
MVNGKPLLIGVVSWGSGCGDPGKYGVYARVNSMLPFIGQFVDVSGGGGGGPAVSTAAPTGTAETAAPTKAVTAAPTSTITDATICQCKGGTGKFETCAKWGYNHPVCLLAYGGDSENPPPCKPTPGGRFMYSSSFNNWYLYGCTPQHQVFPVDPSEVDLNTTSTTSTANNTTDTAVDAASPVSSNDALLAGSIGAIAGCFVGVGAAVVLVKRS